MKITSRASDYALLLVIQLAKLEDGQTSSIKKVASECQISLRFLANISNKLSIARLVSSHRGVGGGIKLAKKSDQITVCEVIEAVEGPIQTMFCQNTDEPCNYQVSCQMKHFWDDLQTMVMDKLKQTSIADLTGKPGLLKPGVPFTISPASDLS